MPLRIKMNFYNRDLIPNIFNYLGKKVEITLYFIFILLIFYFLYILYFILFIFYFIFLAVVENLFFRRNLFKITLYLSIT